MLDAANFPRQINQRNDGAPPVRSILARARGLSQVLEKFLHLTLTAQAITGIENGR